MFYKMYGVYKTYLDLVYRFYRNPPPTWCHLCRLLCPERIAVLNNFRFRSFPMMGTVQFQDLFCHYYSVIRPNQVSLVRQATFAAQTNITDWRTLWHRILDYSVEYSDSNRWHSRVQHHCGMQSQWCSIRKPPEIGDPLVSLLAKGTSYVELQLSIRQCKIMWLLKRFSLYFHLLNLTWMAKKVFDLIDAV